MAKLKPALPEGDTVDSIFERARWKADTAYQNAKERLRSDRGEIDKYMEGLKNEGIVLVQHRIVERIYSNYSINLYKLMEQQCHERNRPYFKCVQTNADRIIVNHVGTGPARGLLTPMLLIAEPIKMERKLVKKKSGYDKMEPAEPDFFNDQYISFSTASVRHWVTSRSITVLFQDPDGHRAFKDWRNQCLATPVNRMLLGVFNYRPNPHYKP
jgi:hypothetical protein